MSRVSPDLPAISAEHMLAPRPGDAGEADDLAGRHVEVDP